MMVKPRAVLASVVDASRLTVAAAAGDGAVATFLARTMTADAPVGSEVP